MNESISLEHSLQSHFNYPHFRVGQKEIITDVMKGHDVLGILPTGSGKSICYQLPAKLLLGTTIVVSPLISLMIDQVKELKAMNFKEVVALNSFMEYKERKSIYENLSSYKLIYVSPEILQQSDVLMYLKRVNINLFVIDEAHCISQWGHEFRPDYLKLKHAVTLLGGPPILALSATATKHVQNDILLSLERKQMIKHIYPMDRPNIAFCVEEVDHDRDKVIHIIDVLTKFNVPTLIYFSSRHETEEVAERLSLKLRNKNIAFYHGGMEPIDRIAIQQQFMNDQLDVICCTSAFGMGINKSNIRLVIHYHFPAQLESYIQEVGRAGRDGSSCTSLLLYSRNDEYLPRKMISNELPDEAEIQFVFKQLLSLATVNAKIPTELSDVNEIFRVNEIQWRFLNSQLEKNGIIIGDKIFLDLELWERSLEAIMDYRNERFLLKQMGLTNMVKWINGDGCLRENLYKTFQNSYHQPTEQCCSNCGYSFSNWQPLQKLGRSNKNVTWKDRLKKTLQVGVSHETS